MNFLHVEDIRFWWDWNCPICGTSNSIDGLYDAEPKAGELLHCAECGKAFEIVNQEDV